MTTVIVTSARKTPRQARSKMMVETILDATARVLVEQGFSGTTTNRIADRAGISVGSLYQYFPSREALVAAVAQRYSETMKASLELLLVQTQAENLKTALRLLLSGITNVHAADPELSRILATELPRLGDMEWRKDIALRAIAIAESLLASHPNELRDGLELKSAAFVVAKASEAVMVSIAQNNDGQDTETIEEALLDMLLLFLVAQKPLTSSVPVQIAIGRSHGTQTKMERNGRVSHI